MTGEFVGRQERQVGEEVAHVLVAGVEPLGDGVDLGAVARRQHDGLRQVLSRAEVVQDLRDAGIVDRRSLEQIEWCGAVVQSDDDDRHAWRRSLASARWPSRIISSIPESSARFQPGCSVGSPRATRSARASASIASELLVLGSELGFELLAQPRGERRALSAGGERHQQRASADPGRHRERAVRGVVRGVDPDAGRLRILEHGAVDRRIAGGGDRPAGSPPPRPVSYDGARP